MAILIMVLALGVGMVAGLAILWKNENAEKLATVIAMIVATLIIWVAGGFEGAF
jgi:hypothetical protein